MTAQAQAPAVKILQRLGGGARVTCQQTERVHLRIDLERATARLTQKQRVALWLWLCGHTQEAIGERLGVTQQAVSRLVLRAADRIEMALE